MHPQSFLIAVPVLLGSMTPCMAKQEVVHLRIPGPFENNFHNLLLYIGYSSLILMIFFCVACLHSLNPRQAIAVMCRNARRRIARCCKRKYCCGKKAKKKGDPCEEKQQFGKSRVQNFEGDQESKKGAAGECAERQSTGKGSDRSSDGQDQASQAQNDLQKQINENEDKIQQNNEKTTRLRRMVQVLQDINNAVPDSDPEKLDRLDKEFKLHEDLLKVEQDTELLIAQNKILFQKQREVQEALESSRSKRTRDQDKDPQEFQGKVSIDFDNEKQVDGLSSHRGLLHPGMQQTSYSKTEDSPAALADAQDCKPQYPPIDQYGRQVVETDASNDLQEDESPLEEMPSARPHFLLIYCALFCGCFCCFLAIVALVASFVNPELSYAIDVDLCKEVPEGQLYDKYYCSRCEKSHCTQCRKDLKVCYDSERANLEAVSLSNFSPCKPCEEKWEVESSDNAQSQQSDTSAADGQASSGSEEQGPTPVPACTSGQFLDREHNKCERCQSDCDECDSTSRCKKCSPYYFLYQTSFMNICEKCSDNCKVCESTLTCRECDPGYDNIDDECVETMTVGNYRLAGPHDKEHRFNQLVKVSGRVEYFNNGQWGTVCDDYFDKTAARVFCRSLNLPSANAVTIPNYGTNFQEGYGPVQLDDLRCLGTEPYLHLCHRSQLPADCSHSQDVGVTCT